VPAVEAPEGHPVPPVSLTERVLACVEGIPPGRVMSYSDVAEYVGIRGARQVGRIMALHGAAVAWHRVVHADGTVAAHLRGTQLRLLRDEGAPMRGDRVDMPAARWDGS
jgi:alkylated DNA nucleotide flippase Atl1